MQPLSDNSLMIKVREGQFDKLGLLYERHKGKLFGFFYNMNGNISLSEDLVQNVFLRILKYRHTFTGEGSFLAWMFKLGRNASHDHYAQNRQFYLEGSLEGLMCKVCDSDSLEEGMFQKERNNQLRLAMSKLEYGDREVLWLSKYQEMKFADIGTILGCTEGAAKVRAHRALGKLREIYLRLDKIR